jgi:SulP family sulfate permease
VSNNGKSNNRLLPKIFPFLQWWPLVNKQTLKADAFAGLTGAVIVLPQGVAFAMIAGLPPIYGLYTAMVVPIVAALFGSSLHSIAGPTTAVSLVIFSTVSQIAEPGSADYIQKVLTITFMVGVYELVLGLARMGTLVNFISDVVVSGFTAGAAVLIVISQADLLIGIKLPQGLSFTQTFAQLGQHFNELNIYAAIIGVGSLLVAIISKKLLPKIPNMLVAIVLGSIAAYFFGGESAGIDLVGPMPSALPQLSSPVFTWGEFGRLAQAAFAIALLALISDIAIVRAVAARSGQQIDANQEFIGQGIANIVGSFFSSYVASGSFTRSGLNYDVGAKTPMSAIFAALFLLLIMLLISPWIAYIPTAAMAGVIVLVGYNLFNFRFIRTVLKASKRQSSVMIITFLATLFFELEYAIYVGVFFSLIFYLQRTSTPNVAVMAPDPEESNRRFKYILRKPLKECPQLKILRIDGSIFFGSVFHIATELRRLTEEENPDIKHVLILCKGVNFIDVAGCEWLANEAEYWKSKGGGLYLSGLKLVAQDSLIRGGYKKRIGEDHFFDRKEEAIPAIFEKLDKGICAACTARIFLECQDLPKAVTDN